MPAPGIYCPYLPSTNLPVPYLIFYRRMLEEQASLINIDCMDPLGKDLRLDSRILARSLKIAQEMEFQDVFVFVLVLRQDRSVDGD